MNNLVTKIFLALICCVLALFSPNVKAVTLTTTTAGGNGQDGNIFDIVTTNLITITGFSVHIGGTCTETVEIYYRADSGYDNTSSMSGWILLDSASVTGGGVGTLVAFPNTLSLTIPAGSTYGFYITTTGSGGCDFDYTNGSSVGAVYTSDSNLSIKEGYGASYPLTGTFSPRVWNGSIHYQTCSNSTFYQDNDGDGFGSSTTSTACSAPSGYVSISGDCNDNDASIYPGASEFCDGQINNCNTSSLPANESDDDGDGYVECSIDSSGWDGTSISGGGDCDDTDSSEYPGVTWYADADGDSFGNPNSSSTCSRNASSDVLNNTDCDDNDAAEFPGVTWYADADGDLFGNPNSSSTCSRNASSDVPNNTDCDDTDGSIYPSASELCDGQINDCNTSTLPVDESDDDGDGYVECTIDVNGWNGGSGGSGSPATLTTTTAGGNSQDGNIFDIVATNAITVTGFDLHFNSSCTETVEVYYRTDSGYDNLSSLSDWTLLDSASVAGLGQGTLVSYPNTLSLTIPAGSTYGFYLTTTGTCSFAYTDGSSVGSIYTSDSNISITQGYGVEYPLANTFSPRVWNGTVHYEVGSAIAGGDDCDDTDATENPTVTWYADADSDTYGNPNSSNICERVASSDVLDNTDCDDTDATEYPGLTWYADADGDTYGNPNSSSTCSRNASSDVTDNTDCDDNDSSEYPGVTWYADADGDSFGNINSSSSCSRTASSDVLDNTDCNDGESTIYPSAPELCDGQVNDCSTTTFTLPVDESDDDGDGYVECTVDVNGWDGSTISGGDDCDDTDATENPTVTWYADADSDTYGNPNSSNICERVASSDVLDNTDCDDTDATEYPGLTWYADADGDTYGNPNSSSTCSRNASSDVTDNTDCDDNDSSEYPGVTWYADADGDMYGDVASAFTCERNAISDVLNALDCNDGESTIYPSAPELCDGQINDCATTTLSVDESDDDGDGYVECTVDVNGWDGSTISGGDDCDDTDATENPTVTWYADADGDMYGDLSTANLCERVASSDVPDNTDCVDSDDTIYPSAVELCDGLDNDCDSVIPTDEIDDDLDGFVECTFDVNGWDGDTAVIADQDCDDSNASTYPGADEFCNLIDDNCDGQVDEDIALDVLTWYADVDNDSYGDPNTMDIDCYQPTGFVTDNTDCVDSDDTIYPSAVELCDGLDNDCDGVIPTDEIDDDLDGFVECTFDVDGWDGDTTVIADQDCDDTSNATYPGATEIPWDGIDQDCDGSDMCDYDGDGVTSIYCGGTDCNDYESTISPNEIDVPNGMDDNCDGLVDEFTSVSDDDGDGYTEDAGDCDDSDSTVNPTAQEVCDNLDNDCDGQIDEDTECVDDDGDGLSEDDGDCNDNDPLISPNQIDVIGNGIDDNCDGIVDDAVPDNDGDGYTEDGGDCDDNDATVYPNADELIDGIDNDCNDLIDDRTSAYDDDGDGYSEDDGDCNDDNANIAPDQEEIRNGIDDNCDGYIDDGLSNSDDDGDGYTEEGGDCDDDNADIAPGVEEIENGIDDDCDGQVDEGLLDADADGFAVEDGDCDDTNMWVNPDVFEICDGLDNNCDGQVDEGCNDIEEETTVTPEKSGCSAVTSTSLTSLMLALIGLRRRRR